MGVEKEDVRFWYVHSRLGGGALNQVTPWVAALIKSGTPINKQALEGLFLQLENAYDDPENAERAVRKLNSLQQGTRPFAKYLALFEKTVLEAGGLMWEASVRKAMLAKGLSPEIQRALVATPMPVSYEAYCSLLHTVSHNLESLRTNEKMWEPRKAMEAVPTDPMDWEASRTNRTGKRQGTNARTKEAGEEEDRRRCYRCAEEGHIARHCPNDLAKKERQVKKVKKAKGKRKSEKPIARTKAGRESSTEEESSSEERSSGTEESGKE
jgi:hypothetical protein